MDLGHFQVGDRNEASLHMSMIWPRKLIQEHHMVQPYLNIVQYLGQEAIKNGLDIPTSMLGVVKAELHRGLWIVRCPADRCSGAVGVDSRHPVSMCPDCGAGWFRVEFPINKAAIESELLKRPIPPKGLIHANWHPYHGLTAEGKPTGKEETLAQLRRETKELLAEYAEVVN